MRITKALLKKIIAEEVGNMAAEQPQMQQQAQPRQAGEEVSGQLPKFAAKLLIGALEGSAQGKRLAMQLEKLKAASNPVKAEFLGFLASELLDSNIKDIAAAAAGAQGRQVKKAGV